ncbi:MAG: aconitate hydratase, partial [Sphaerochaetaceae bacterium]|nr:aconitate hydratase [Sphaerochaetaceae bacterium]
VPERATITNMGAECGVTFSIFPSDEVTKAFLEAQGRGSDWSELVPDKDAQYDGLYEIDLSTLEPMVAAPHSPGNVSSIKEIEGMVVDQVLIGSCTNSSYADLVKVGNILEGKTVAKNVSLGIAPGSREVLMLITKDGTLAKMVAAGARILESACGFCIGNHQSPNSHGISLRTNNRNFEGRSGTKDAQVYLVSPETAALSAIAGVVVDPLKEKDPSKVAQVNVKDFGADDSMFIFPPADGKDVEVLRGPNIGNPPENTALSKDLKGKVAIKVGDKITTDHIMPAGARLKYRSNIPTYSTFVFEGVDKDFASRCSQRKSEGVANFIVAGASYGQGSSREHAAICPMYLGVKAIMAVSIERIHQANLCNFGILPLTFVNEKDYEKFSSDSAIEILDAPQQVKDAVATGKTVKVMVDGSPIEMNLVASQQQAEMLLMGGRLNQIKESL